MFTNITDRGICTINRPGNTSERRQHIIAQRLYFGSIFRGVIPIIDHFNDCFSRRTGIIPIWCEDFSISLCRFDAVKISVTFAHSLLLLRHEFPSEP